MRVLCLVGCDPSAVFTRLGWEKRDARGATLPHQMLVDRFGVVVGAYLGRVQRDTRLQDWLRQQASVGLYVLVVLEADDLDGPFMDETGRYAAVDIVLDDARVAEFMWTGGRSDG